MVCRTVRGGRCFGIAYVGGAWVGFVERKGYGGLICMIGVEDILGEAFYFREYPCDGRVG